MGLRVNTNVASIGAQRNLFNVTSRLQGNYSRLSSGLRIASASDDAAGLGISEKMRSQISSYRVAGRNAMDGLSMSQTAEGALGEVGNILGRMRELAVQGANGTLSTEDRATIDVELGELEAEITRLSGEAEFNGVQLLDGTGGTAGVVSIQVGIDAGETIDLDFTQVMDAATLSVDSLTVDNATNAGLAITAIDAAITTVSSVRGEQGAAQNRLQSSIRSIQSVTENLSAAESRIRDVDVAYETADLSRNSILQQAATSVLAQANAQPQLALSLLG